MFSRILTQTSTAPYSDQLAKMQQVLEQADAIMIEPVPAFLLRRD